jgi:predicted permease
MTKKTFRLTDSRPDPQREVHDELRFHLDMRTQEFIEQGMAPDDARRAAMESFGDVTSIEDELRAERGAREQRVGRRERWSSVVQDVRLSFRALRRRPLFAASTIMALGLGIGAAGSVFAVVNGVLLRPLPYEAPDRLAMIWLRAPEDMGGDRWPLSSGFFDLFRTRNRSFTSVAAFRSWPYTLGDFSVVEQVRGARVSPGLFATLGVRPLLGRAFTDAEGEVGGARVVMLSHSLWQNRFGGDPKIIGRSITLGNERFEVVGVMPRDFSFPRGAELLRGLQFPARTDLWTPLVLSPADRRDFGAQNLAAVARLRPGVTTAQAHDDVQALVSALLKEANFRMQIGDEVVVLRDQAAQPVRRGLLLLLGAVVVVLLIAGANVAGLLSARVHERRRELAVRMALGARRGRVGRQLLTETLVLALAGGAAGAALTAVGTRLLVALVPSDLPRADDISVGVSVLVAIALMAVLCGMAFGVIAMRGLTITSPAQALRGVSTRASDSRGARAGRRMLVTAQVALSVLLLVGAGLLLRSFARLQSVRPGFDPEHALTGGVSVPIAGAFNPQRDGPSWVRFFDELMPRVAQLPGVVAAGATSALPLTGGIEGSTFVVVGREPPRPEDAPQTAYAVIAGDFFRAAGVALLQGRAFDARDRTDAPRVAIISRALAAKQFGTESPVGHQVRGLFEFDRSAGPREIIGVVDDVKYGSLDEEAGPVIYVPESQMSYPGLSLVVRTSGAPEGVVSAVRSELRAVNASVALADVKTLADVMRQSLARQRFTLTLIGAFAATALGLAVLGLYGVIAMSVQARRHELGVRLALGARPASLVRLVVGEGMRLAAVGVGLGLAGALGVAGSLRALLYGVGARDVSVYLAAALVVAIVALIASYLPARRAAGGNPTEALRVD